MFIVLESNFSKSLSVFQHAAIIFMKSGGGLSYRRVIWNRGVNAEKNDRFVHMRASTCNHWPRKPLCFSNSEFDSCINSPSVHNSFTATRPRRRFWMQNPRESKQSTGGDVCAVRFDNNPRALFCRVLPAIFFPSSMFLSLSFSRIRVCI